MRIGLAFSCFFKILRDAEFAAQVRRQLAGPAAPAAAAPAPAAKEAPATKAPPAPRRSDAIALLAALQREARLVDIVSEPLEGYTDAQIGAAARDVLRDCGRVLARLFALEPVVAGEEGSAVEVPAGYDTGRYKLAGNVSRQPPLTGQLAHAGWQATRCELPAWTGSSAAALVVAPAEVQVD